MNYRKYILFAFVLLLLAADHKGQTIVFDNKYNVTKSIGDDLFPSWSDDGSKLAYQSNRNGNWDILIYNLKTDSSTFRSNSSFNERHPVWIRQGLAFDADKDGLLKIYTLSEKDSEMKLLFDRKIQVRQPSFSKSEKLVYFSGFDDLKNRWEIYSYEFFYNNLNKLTELVGKSFSPKVSPDTDYVLFQNESRNYPQDRLHLINWYGNPEKEFVEYNIYNASWAPGGLKIFFVSDMDDKTGEIYSMWVDGSHLERLTEDAIEVRNPVVSPDGRFLAVSVKLENGFDIFLIPLEDY